MPRRENHQAAAIVRRSFGTHAFTAESASAAGISRSALETATRAGTMHREMRGLYSSGEDAFARARHLIEDLASRGIRAAVGGRTAAELWGIPVFGPRGSLAPAPLTLIVSRGAGVREGTRSGLRLRTGDLCDEQIVHVDPQTKSAAHLGVPVTTPLRTGLDVVRDVGRSRASALVPLCGAMRAHIRLHIVEDGAPEGAVTEAARVTSLRRELVAELRSLARLVNAHGMKWFHVVLPDTEPLVETALEGLAWAHITDSALPRPRPQEWVRGASGRSYRVDFLVGERVILECDGAVKYSDQTPWQEKQRQSDLEAAGYSVVRCTWEELIHRPRDVLERILRALSRCGDSHVTLSASYPDFPV